MKNAPERRAVLRRNQGINLVEVVIAATILSVVSLAALGAMNMAFHASADPESKAIAQTDVSNVSTDLNVIAMYDQTAINNLSKIGRITITPAAPVPGASYAPSDTRSATLTISGVTPSANNASASLSVTYSIPGGSSNSLNGTSKVVVTQRAPSRCASLLQGTTATAGDGTAC